MCLRKIEHIHQYLKLVSFQPLRFMTDELSEAISEANLTGIDMEKCEVKAKCFF